MSEKNIEQEKKDYMLTTTDNPYSPFDQFDQWYAYDVFHGYHTCEYIGRIARTSPSLSESDNDEAYDDAMNAILELNPNGMYVKRSRDFYQKSKKES